uniref:Very long-chain fatty acid transport protein n=1 Tax=Tetranychus urticae TaxID=32264 RepID=T1KBI6_TETUR
MLEIKKVEYHSLIYQGKVWTFKDLDSFSNRIAQTFVSAGYKPGDDVALFMDNRPEFVGIWLGAAKAGLTTAFLNTNLKSSTLLHSISAVKTRALIYDSALESVVQDLLDSPQFDRSIDIYSYGDKQTHDGNKKEIKALKPLLDHTTDEPVNHRGNFSDRLFYIYTSGTTGLPKAAIITNARFFVFGYGIHKIMEMQPNDILYTPLPLYHFAGTVLGTSQCILYGTSIVLRNKFSAKHFWDDCRENGCTVAQYIGEVARYLLAVPPSEKDRDHKVRCVYGNGFRPSLWSEFKNRFGIERIVEFYGATEGNSSTVNLDNREGSCGFITVLLPQWILKKLYPVMLIRVDQETGEPLRNEKGLCERCKPGEVGQLVGLIKHKDPIKQFDGYADNEATKKKIIRNVFTEGDTYYASGDLLTMDELGYFYFKDRTGDTYRWKGENVSTGEVEAVIGAITNHADTVVYGVIVPGNEGRAGMAAIKDTTGSLDLKDLLNKMKKELPQYAIPVFIRLTSDIEITSTFKMPKVNLKKEGYDINLIKDSVFVLDSKSEEYKKLDENIYKKIISGEFKF